MINRKIECNPKTHKVSQIEEKVFFLMLLLVVLAAATSFGMRCLILSLRSQIFRVVSNHYPVLTPFLPHQKPLFWIAPLAEVGNQISNLQV
ncbi:hypothetical protein [Streptococcus dysgalactiae]|uniref:hypothetical protein n=1 Tax=Streptococcus dysgalactiae TaxID=1334 RepID=UPI003FD7E04B